MGPTPLAPTRLSGDHARMKDLTHNCPYCELRFEYHEEIKDHIVHDHPEHADVAATIEVHELPHT